VKVPIHGGSSLGALRNRLLRRGQPEPYGGSIRDNPNPIPPTPQSLAIGQRIYREQCEVCHGVVGAGDGPGAAALDPRLADLRIHMAAGPTDGEFFFWISEGFKGTAMPAFKGRLSDEERWHVLNFIKTLVLTDR